MKITPFYRKNQDTLFDPNNKEHNISAHVVHSAPKESKPKCSISRTFAIIFTRNLFDASGFADLTYSICQNAVENRAPSNFSTPMKNATFSIEMTYSE